MIDPAKLASLPETHLRYYIWQMKWEATRRDKQTPPDGDWTEWGILAGRGFGKTLTGAQWLSKQAFTDVKKFPRAVIAPTLNDVRHTCFEGPAGILAIVPPELVYDYNKTNLIITLCDQNDVTKPGSIIRGFSAEEPERMRGPQFADIWCFTAGTQVSVPGGTSSIELLCPGDIVLTRKGPRKVLANSERKAQVGRVTFENGAELVGTAEHPVYLSSGWTRLDQLAVGDTACAIVASSGVGNAGTSTVMTPCRTTSERIRAFAQSVRYAFTGKNGLMLMDRSPMGLTSTTSTTTNSTTGLKIWNAYRPASTTGYTYSLNLFPGLIGLNGHSSALTVSTAEPSFNENWYRLNPAVNHAVIDKQKNDEKPIAFAQSVEQPSDPGLELCAVSVASTWQPEAEQSVFCLKVADEPEYFANGILVHNCDELAAWNRDEDTWDMAMMGLRLGPLPKVVWTTTPKPKDLVRKLVTSKEGRIITAGSTYDNRANLPKSFFEQLKQYEGTQLGRQELDGELIDAEEGGIVARSSFRLWPSKRVLPAFDWIIMSLDTAFTEKTLDKRTHTADSTACTVWGVFWHEDKRQVMLLDCWDDQLGLPDLMKRVKKEMNVAYGDDQDVALIKPMIGSSKMAGSGRRPDILLIEDKGSGISLRQMLDREGITAYAYNPGRADKLTRLHMVSHIFARRQVWLPESERIAGRPKTWAEPMIAQLCSFTGSGSIKHDDYVDSVTQAIRLCLDKGLLEGSVMPKRGEERYVATMPRVNPYAV